MTTRTTPKQSGFSMPPEWGPHLRTWMMWPTREIVWDDMEETRANYATLAHAIREFEPLSMVVSPCDVAAAKSLLGSDIGILEAPIDDSWARDAGPCFVTNGKGERVGVSFGFNAWGGKYTPFDADNGVAEAIASAAGVATFQSDLIAEGGGVSVDGLGTILTTTSCFPNPNRNPDWSRDEIEEELKQMLGGDKVIWLPGNVEETETDGHVDGIATFVAPGVVLIEGAGPVDSEWHDICQANIDAMQNQTDARGNRIRLVEIPEADEADNPTDSDKFCRSYINSYITNGGVIMPRYGVKTDDEVREVFQELFPGRRVSQVSIPSIAIGGGGIHCITQQEPAA